MESKKLVIGILAHVDSGKTTLAESMLYLSGSIRTLGRVDHRNTFLDTHEMERTRGITIFAKQALFQLHDKEITLLDTPGHVDFSAEMERTLQVLDYAILVISGADGVQGHTQTLWKLLKRYEIPTFLFINKMDQPGIEKENLIKELGKKLDEHCIDFGIEKSLLQDQLAMCNEHLMDEFLEQGEICDETIKDMIFERNVFPCYFGSALKQDGVLEFLNGMAKYMKAQSYQEEFGARVFKIARDEQNNRLTYIKVTGGVLKVKDLMSGIEGNQTWQEKIDQIRIYSGGQYKTELEVGAGTVCAVTGLNSTYSGQGIGIEIEPEIPILEPVLTYMVKGENDCDLHTLYLKLCQLEEEEPELHIVWNDILQEIHVQVMGEVQIEVLKKIIKERYQTDVVFDTGNIVYKESIEEPVVGIGHFEPLRHYAEVHLLLEPLERGSGLEFATDCSEDVLDRNWQRLILTHLEEKKHKGVLVGAEITDMKITLVTGKAHLKHTEGGDFRQATYRAIRQGLKTAKSILLEPYYEFHLELPQEVVGRAMSDIQRMNGNFETPLVENGMAVLEGRCPVITMRDYHKEVISYSKGGGKLFCSLWGYDKCHNEEEIISNKNYDSETDLENPTGSVFCSHGAGFVVPWDKVPEYAHLKYEKGNNEEREIELQPIELRKRQISSGIIDQEEIDEIFERTFGKIKQKRNGWSKTIATTRTENYHGKEMINVSQKQEEYLLVDGYNIIFAWHELKELAQVNIDSARDKLMDIMCYYQGVKKCRLILVFDAYKVSGGQGAVFDYHNIHVVYTKEAETADQYIEKVTHELGKKYRVSVATSDRLEQMIIWGAGANRISAQGLLEAVESAREETQLHMDAQNNKEKIYPLENLLRDIKKEL